MDRARTILHFQSSATSVLSSCLSAGPSPPSPTYLYFLLVGSLRHVIALRSILAGERTTGDRERARDEILRAARLTQKETLREKSWGGWRQNGEEETITLGWNRRLGDSVKYSLAGVNEQG